MIQTLDGFIVEMRADIDAFEKWWMEQHAKDPESFPLSANSGDWFEQFVMFDKERNK